MLSIWTGLKFCPLVKSYVPFSQRVAPHFALRMPELNSLSHDPKTLRKKDFENIYGTGQNADN